MKQQLSKPPKPKLKPLLLATRFTGEDTQYQMAEHPNDYDWDVLRAKYPNPMAFETRQVFKGIHIRTALFGLIAFLNARGVNFFKTLSGSEVLKFNWNNKLAIIYAKSDKELGRANPAGHDAVDAYQETLRKDKEAQAERKPKTVRVPMDTVTLFHSVDDLVRVMMTHCELLDDKSKVYNSMREYLLFKANIAVFTFEFNIIDVYYEWLKTYHSQLKKVA